MRCHWTFCATRSLPLAFCFLALCASSAHAQSGSMFGSRLSNPSGSATSPSIGGFGSIASGSSPFASGSGSRGSSMGMSGLGMSGTGFGSQSGVGMSGGGFGTGTSGTGFVGRDTSGRFVGSNQAGTQQSGMSGRNGQLNQFRSGGTGRGFSNTGAQGFNAQGGQGGENAPAGAAKLLHPQQRANFTFKQPAADAPAKSLAIRFEHLASRPALQGVSGLKFDMQGNVLVLRGSVESEETKRLVGMMAGLEPGLHKVRNELTIGHSVPTPPPALDQSVPTPVIPRN